MFDKLTSSFQKLITKLQGKGHISEKNVDDAVKLVRKALLNADVNHKVVKQIIANIKEKALGQVVVHGVTPTQMFIKIVYDELVNLLGGMKAELELSKSPAIITLFGLQGSGKTTTAAKLAKFLKEKKSKKVLLVAADIYRPAAIDQLKVLSEKVEVDFFQMGKENPVKIVDEAIKYAKRNNLDTIIVDTAGRLHIDEEMMKELQEIVDTFNPDERILVIDAMLGQQAAKVAKEFNEKIDLTGLIVTKMDGDARGGALLTVVWLTNKPVKFLGTSEHIEGLEEFYPDRIASRILGMGDIVSLVEKAQEAVSKEYAEKMKKKIKNLDFNLNDYLEQLRNVKKMGSLGSIIDMIPGMAGKVSEKELAEAEKHLKKAEVIISSMTKSERENPYIINASRKKRIAKGAGVKISDVNKLLKEYEQMRKMLKGFRGLMFGKKGKKSKRNPLMEQLSKLGIKLPF